MYIQTFWQKCNSHSLPNDILTVDIICQFQSDVAYDDFKIVKNKVFNFFISI